MLEPDNSTWAKGHFYKEICVDIPTTEEQNSVVEIYNGIETYERIITELEDHYNNIIEKNRYIKSM